MKDLGEPKKILGITITIDKEAGTTKLTQTDYIQKIVDEFCENKSPAITPATGNKRLTKEMCPAFGSEEHLMMKEKPYRRLIGSLMYVYTSTRPDIGYQLSTLSKFLENPGYEHWNEAMLLVRYLRDTKDIGLTYKRNPNHNLYLHAYADSDHAGDKDTRRSRSGGVIMLCGNPVHWVSKMQATVSISSAEAEINALLTVTKSIVYIANLLGDLNVRPKGSILVYEDNTGCIEIVNNPVINEKSKHMGVHYHYIKQNIEEKVIEVRKIDSEWNIADIFTKPLAPAVFPALRDLLFNHEYNC